MLIIIEVELKLLLLDICSSVWFSGWIGRVWQNKGTRWTYYRCTTHSWWMQAMSLYPQPMSLFPQHIIAETKTGPNTNEQCSKATVVPFHWLVTNRILKILGSIALRQIVDQHRDLKTAQMNTSIVCCPWNTFDAHFENKHSKVGKVFRILLFHVKLRIPTIFPWHNRKSSPNLPGNGPNYPCFN